MHKTVYTRQYAVLLHELRAARTRSGLTQNELAIKLEMSQADVSKCERGVRRLDVIELRLWVEALGERLVDFLSVVEDHLEVDVVRSTRKAIPG